MRKYKLLNRPYNIEDHKRLVTSIASNIYRQYNLPPYIDIDDLIQEGMIGLLDAHENYDAQNANGASLPTYARIRIRGAILDYIRSQSFTPRQLNNEIKIVSEISKDFIAKNEREPSRVELSNLSGLPLEKIELIYSGINYSEIRDTDEDGDAVERSIPSHINDPELVIDLQNQLESSMSSLSEIEQKVMALYYIEGLTLVEISKIIDKTAPRVSQILAHTKKLLLSSLNKV